MIPLAAGFLAGSVPWRAVLIVALLAATFAAGWKVNGRRWEVRMLHEQAEQQNDQLEAQRQARTREQQLRDAQQEATREHAKFDEQAAATRAAGSARTAVAIDGLRQRVAAATSVRPSDPATFGQCQAETRLGAALLACAAEYRDLADEGDRRVDEARGAGIECQREYESVRP